MSSFCFLCKEDSFFQRNYEILDEFGSCFSLLDKYVIMNKANKIKIFSCRSNLVSIFDFKLYAFKFEPF